MTNGTVSVVSNVDNTTWLPGVEDVGRSATWMIPSGDRVLRVNARFLGMGTSFGSQHRHPSDRPAHRNEKCRACRWFEPRIFREVDGVRRYLVHRTGRSTVPSEVSYTSHEWVLTSYEVIEVLTTRRSDEAYLTHPAARALAQAASLDPDINDAYVNRAVA